MTDNRLPGVAVGVWVPGRGSYVRAFGIGDRATGAPVRVGDHLRIASITKTFTATAALQLVDQGRLSLDDRLSTFVGGVPNGDRITVRQLLDMTAGVYDYTADEAFGKRFYANPRLPFGPRQFFAILRRHRPAFAPGAGAMYSDSNYYLLGADHREGHRPAGGAGDRGPDHHAARADPHELPDGTGAAAAVRARLLRRSRRHGAADRRDGEQPLRQLDRRRHGLDPGRPAQNGPRRWPTARCCPRRSRPSGCASCRSTTPVR